MRVFLSHSSRDKSIVAAVANKLGRSYVVYDEYSFDTAEESSPPSIEDSIGPTYSSCSQVEQLCLRRGFKVKYQKLCC